MTLSIVVPMFKTAASLPELMLRLSRAVPIGTEVVLVDDACPHDSWSLALSMPADGLAVKVIRLSRNVGQFAAVQVGFTQCTGEMIAVMDADLQDPPESLPKLVSELDRSTTTDVVCSVRSGKYESWFRRWTARLYRRTAHLLSRGRIPMNAGMFLVARRRAVSALIDLGDPLIPIVPGLARAGADMKGFEVHRHPRLVGRSSYSFRARLALAARGLSTLTPLQPLLARANRVKWARLDCHAVTVRQ